ncbi:MAG: hypothetical protein OEZ58_21260, partial [Gammaproteobacteria bacterium]|nr:hypothetical protein [Gammaproteobacteria bacterium]
MNRSHHFLILKLELIVLLVLLQACGNAARETFLDNQAPQLKNIQLMGHEQNAAHVNDELSVEFEYFDREGDVEHETKVTWLRDGEPIPDAATATYKIQHADLLSEISVLLQPYAIAGTQQGDSIRLEEKIKIVSTMPVVNNVKVNNMSRSSNNAEAGDVLVVEYEYFDIDLLPEELATKQNLVDIQWVRNGSPIEDATSKSYTIRNEDFGKLVSVLVRPRDDHEAEFGEAEELEIGLIGNSAPTVSTIVIAANDSGLTQVRVNNRLQVSYVYHDINGHAQG